MDPAVRRLSTRPIYRKLPLYAAYLTITTVVVLGLYVSWWCAKAKDLGVSFSSKGQLLSVQPGSLAALSGARPGDVTTFDDLQRLYQFSREARVGDTLRITVAPSDGGDRYTIRLEARHNSPGEQFDLSQEALTGIGFALLGAAPLVARRRTFSLWLFFFATECIALLLITDVPRRLHQTWAEPVAYTAMPLFPAILFHFHTLFPQSRFGRWRPVVVSAVYLLATVLVPLSLVSMWDYSFYASVAWQITYSLYVMGVLLACVLLLVRSFVVAQSRLMRTQLKTILAFSGTGMLVTALLPFVAGGMIAFGVFGELGLGIADSVQRVTLASALLTPIGYAYAIVQNNLLVGAKLWRSWLVRTVYTSCSILLVVGGLILIAGYMGMNWAEALESAAPMLLSGLVIASLVVSLVQERAGTWLEERLSGDRSLARLLEECTEELQRFRDLGEYVRFFTAILPARINSLGSLVFLIEGDTEGGELVLRGASPSLPIPGRRCDIPPISRDSEIWTVFVDVYRPVPLFALLVPESFRSERDIKLLQIMKDAHIELLLPLTGRQHAQRQLIGLVAMGEKETDEPYSAQEISALAALTSAASASAENVLMFEALQARVVELGQERELSAALARDVSTAQEDERARISKDIHDTVLQELGIAVRLLARLRDNLQQALGALEDSEITLERLSDPVHAGAQTWVSASASCEIQNMLRDCQAILGSLLGESATDLGLGGSDTENGQISATLSAPQFEHSPDISGKYLVEDVLLLVRSTSQRLRNICNNLHPAYLDAPLIKTLSRSLQRLGQLSPDVTIDTTIRGQEPSNLGDHVKYACKKVTEQAVYNALKHAEPSRITVELGFPDTPNTTMGPDGIDLQASVALYIADDGKGFEPRTPHYWRATQHHGLANMYETATLIGGALEIRSAPGQGTRVTLHVPLELRGERMVDSNSVSGLASTPLVARPTALLLLLLRLNLIKPLQPS